MDFPKNRALIFQLESKEEGFFQSQELQENSVCRKFRQTASDRKDYTTICIFRISSF